MNRRFQIRIDPVWRPLLVLGGATRENSFVEVTDDAITFSLGLLFRRTIPRSEVKAAFRRSWPLLYGVGWRSNLRGVIGLIGSYDNVVEVRLHRRQRPAWLVFPCDRICASLEDPDAFVDLLGDGPEGAEPPRRTRRPAASHGGARARTRKRRPRR
jgi:hypothetical protein